MVGGWSYRKGCDLILDAIKAMNLRFLHVGALVDLPFPQGDSMFSHVDAVEQRQLVGFTTGPGSFFYLLAKKAWPWCRRRP